MTLGIFAKIFNRPSVEEVFAAVAKLRLRSVQFNFASAGLPSLPDQIDRVLVKRIRKAADEHHIAIAAVSGTFNMIHPDARRRREGLGRLAVIAGACAGLETQVITVCTGTRDPENMWRRHPDNDSPEAWCDLLVTLTKALTTADKHDITLGVEPETGNVIDSAPKARRLLDELRSPRLKIVIDVANLFHPGELPRMTEIMEDAFDLLGGDLILAHAKELDHYGRVGNRAPGQGSLDWDLYFALLRRVNYAGPFIAHGCEERDVAAILTFLREKGMNP